MPALVERPFGGQMPTLYSADTVTIGAAGPGSLDSLNDTLAAAGLGRPLGPLSRVAGQRVVVQVSGVSPGAVRDVLAASVDIRLDPVYLNGTFRLDGQDFWHGFAPSGLSEGLPDPPWTPPRPGLRRPVIALFDSGIRDHPWLPRTGKDDPFVLRSDDPRLDRPWISPLGDPKDDDPQSGHGTFLAGLIRKAAPDARVLDVRVMTGDGKVLESTLVDALCWLEAYRAAGHPVDVLCLAFGRRPGPDEAIFEPATPLARLAEAGVAIVASAGNDHRDAPVHPAALPGVTAVGAGFGEYHARFSNHGDWVQRYRDGVDQISIFPPDRWAVWSGTSFSAATMAADLARPQVIAR
jgi:hypothetical protein